MNDFFYGLYYPFKCLNVLKNNKRLIKLSIVPVLINLLIYGTIFILVYKWALVKSEQLTGADSIHSLWWQEVLYVFIVIISFIVIVIFCYLIFLFLSGIITAPFNEKISQVSEEIITGETLVSGTGFFKDLYSSSRDELIKLSFYFLVIFIFFLIGMIPLIGGIFSAIFGFLFSVFFCALDFLDYPMARKLLPLRKKISIVSRGGMLTFGFGLTSFILMFIPFLNVFTKPLLVISGTLLYYNKFDKKKRYN
ncbi:MAG TPA: EI24 domain-containing protein [Ignavibacteria bacterium]